MSDCWRVVRVIRKPVDFEFTDIKLAQEYIDRMAVERPGREFAIVHSTYPLEEEPQRDEDDMRGQSEMDRCLERMLSEVLDRLDSIECRIDSRWL